MWSAKDLLKAGLYGELVMEKKMNMLDDRCIPSDTSCIAQNPRRGINDLEVHKKWGVHYKKCLSTSKYISIV
jgi:hypothetical protein